jgi:isopropylmalate/homocitrate/citramalate synthase
MDNVYDDRELNYRSICFDWEVIRDLPSTFVGFVDETIRDGLQTPHCPQFNLEDRLAVLRHMDACAFSDCIIGMIGVDSEKIAQLVPYFGEPGISIFPWVLCRVDESDISSAVSRFGNIDDKVGINLFLNLGPLRHLAEDWNETWLFDNFLSVLKIASTGFGRVRVAFEDASRTHPQMIARAIKMISEFNVERIVIADTCGTLSPSGVANLFGQVKEMQRDCNSMSKLEWHGHNDRGLGVASSLAAIESGASYIHGTILGIGERNGNAALDQIVANLGIRRPSICDWNALRNYHDHIFEKFHSSLSKAYPYFGKYSNATSTGTHSAAMYKAIKNNMPVLSRILFSPISPISMNTPPSFLISHLTGRLGVVAALTGRELACNDATVSRVLSFAKSVERTVTDEELLSMSSERMH